MTEFWSKQAMPKLCAFSVAAFVTSVALAETTVNRPGEVESAPAVEADPLNVLVDQAISRTRRRFLDANRHTPWQIMHGLLALRKEFELNRNGERINAIDYLSDSARYGGNYWFEKTPHGGRAHPFTVPYAFEGHVNQSLALLSMSGIPSDHEFKVGGRQVVTMADMVRHAQMNVNTNEETTWTLWFLTHYVDQNAEWLNQNGEPWSMERLVRLQVQGDVTRAPCGGTHQLFALAFARNAQLDQVGRLSGGWTEADQKLRRYIAAARSLQNADGSFSTAYFKGREFSYEFNERIKSSGHMLEWLMMALPDRDLDEMWVRRAVEAVSRDLVNNASQPADCGPLYHALHSLVLYQERVVPPETPSVPPTLELVETKPELQTPGTEPSVTVEEDSVASSETTAPAAPQPLPRISLYSTGERSKPNLPPPPPSRVDFEPTEIASSPDTVAEGIVEDEDLPPLPPRRPVQSATTESGSVTR